MSDRSRPQLRGPTVAPGMAAVRLLTPASRRMSADAPAADVTSHADAPPVSARLALWLGTAFGAKGCVGRRRLLSVGVPITSPRHDLGIAMKSGAGVRGRESRSRSVVEHEGLGARSSADGEPSSGAFAASGSKHGSRWARPGRFSHGLLPYQSRLPMAPDTSVSVSCEPLARLTSCSADTALAAMSVRGALERCARLGPPFRLPFGEPRQVDGIERMIGRANALWRLCAWSRQGTPDNPPGAVCTKDQYRWPVVHGESASHYGAPNQRGFKAVRAGGGFHLLRDASDYTVNDVTLGV